MSELLTWPTLPMFWYFGISDCHGQPWGFPEQPAPVPAKTRTRDRGCGFLRVRVRVFIKPMGNVL
jgi:hypothetical protein